MCLAKGSSCVEALGDHGTGECSVSDSQHPIHFLGQHVGCAQWGQALAVSPLAAWPPLPHFLVLVLIN